MNIQETQIKDIVISGRHGAFESEQNLNQNFSVDVVYTFNAGCALRTKKLSDTIDYFEVIKLIQDHIGNQKRFHVLLESMIDDLSRELGETFPIISITLSVRKLDIPWTPRVSVKKYFYKNLLNSIL